jgi:hypothetical protein
LTEYLSLKKVTSCHLTYLALNRQQERHSTLIIIDFSPYPFHSAADLEQPG